jgi:hypothetical protein
MNLPALDLWRSLKNLSGRWRAFSVSPIDSLKSHGSAQSTLSNALGRGEACISSAEENISKTMSYCTFTLDFRLDQSATGFELLGVLS